MAADRDAQLRNIIAGYNDTIRLSDAKALIGVLFVAIMMGTVVQYRDLYPPYLTLPVLLPPFMFIFVNLLVSVYPRFPRTGRSRFPIRRRMEPDDFDFLMDTRDERETLPDRCAMFSRMLWWKTITLQMAYVASMASIVAAGILLFVARG
jgi:hypothetical protein